MNEAKYELKNWKKWKRTVQLLEETRDQLKDMKKGINIDPFSMPGSGHKSTIEQMDKIIEQCEQYDQLIEYYNFFINRLEKALTELLDETQREVCLIYANYKNFRQKEFEAIKKGYTTPTFYRILNDSCNLLNTVLSPTFEKNMRVKSNENDI